MSTSSSPPDVSDHEKQEAQAAAEAAAPIPQRQVRGVRWFLVVAAILSSMFVYALDNTVTADLGPAIINEFGSAPLLPWLSVGFVAGGVVVLLPVGKLYSKYNAKWLYIANLVLFLGASALCGAAPNMSAMIVGRVFLGVGGNGMYCGILTLLTAYTEERERPGYLSLIGFVWGIGTVLGPVVGGAFEKVDWRWSFYINLIICGVFMPVYLFLLPSFDPMPAGLSARERIRGYDFLGTTLFTGFVISFLMAVNFGGALYEWDSAREIALFVVAGVLFLAFVAQQKFAWLTTTAERIFPVKMLHVREALLLFASSACANAAAFGAIFYVPVYFQFTRGDSALDAAVRLLPLIILLSTMILANGFFLGKLGYYFPWYCVGSALAIVGNVLLSRIDVNTSQAAIYGYEVLIGLGTGAFIQAGYATIQTTVAPYDLGYAIPFMMVAQFTGITLSLSISGAIFVNEALSGLRSLLPMVSQQEISAILSGTSDDAINAVPEALRGATIEAIVDALRKVFIPGYVAAAVAFVLSFFLNKKNAFGAAGKDIAVTV
ncbi:major facilitator superfamily transporter [Cercophora newfieldiana]|uniref:Major facilitator superfamily transporter n=1 Tax=Cercophora newfieldiana TaxID=92897 RepID=A0AA39Y1S9_9PEZI|nr:major facilitator superfamily transporter [Cercophora newfieldiana]